MREIGLFVEDGGHEEFCDALISRLARQYGIEVHIQPKNVRGGHGKVLRELKQYIRDLQRSGTPLLDLVVIAIDSNCQKLLQRTQEIDKIIPEQFRYMAAYAIPDPHVERWMLIDAAAFKQVFGKGCQAPDQKCDKDRYKRLLMEAICSADPSLQPSFGGMEYAEDIVNVIDFDRIHDKSLHLIIQDLTRIFKQWSRQ